MKNRPETHKPALLSLDHEGRLYTLAKLRDKIKTSFSRRPSVRVQNRSPPTRVEAFLESARGFLAELIKYSAQFRHAYTTRQREKPADAIEQRPRAKLHETNK